MSEERLEDYILGHISEEPEYLRLITRSTNLDVLNPHMLSGHLQGRVLSMLGRMLRPRRVLELGTYTGYSALCLAEGAEEVVTIERNDELEERIKHNLSLSPFGGKVRPLTGDALAIVPQLEGLFELVFIDADKREYNDYLDVVLPKVPAGGWIAADNTLWDGHVADPAYDHDKQTLGLRAFNDRVAADKSLATVILPVRDGLTLIQKLR
ncbi:MAG: O-methyltransferase [Paludibacteraceae bacterium]|nr:O-methyltransferase [Paludibacteraceae bacterium]